VWGGGGGGGGGWGGGGGRLWVEGGGGGLGFLIVTEGRRVPLGREGFCANLGGEGGNFRVAEAW